MPKSSVRRAKPRRTSARQSAQGWSAARQAEEVAWLHGSLMENMAAHLRGEDVPHFGAPTLAGVQQYFGSDMDALKEYAGDAGVDLPEDFPRKWLQARHASLEIAPLFVISPEMLQVVLAAARCLTREDIEHAHDVREQRRGFLLMPDTLKIATPFAESQVEIDALAWLPSRTAERHRDGSQVQPQSMVPTTRMMTFSRPSRPGGGSSNRLVHDTEAWFWVWKTDEGTWGEGLPSRSVEHVADDTVDDTQGIFLAQFLVAFWRLCDQQIAETTARASEPTSKQRAARRAHWPEVRVVALRRRKRRTDTSETRTVDWRSRWVVQMHRRWQWYPSEGRHRLIFVGPYIKGPEDRPLTPTPTRVTALSR